MYKNRCENPRPSIFGEPYNDKPGSAFEEKMWLRSWSDETYLWYNEIIDQDVALFSNALEYFDQLKTNTITSSGTPRDQFHYALNTAEYQQQISTGSTAGYGTSFTFIETTPPRKVIVALTEPNSPASSVSLQRGAEVLEIDGVDFVYGEDIETLNNGLFPQTVGEVHTFVVRDAGSNTTRTITMQTDVVTINPVFETKVINTDLGKLGYVAFNTFALFSAEKALYDTFSTLEASGVNDLVLDLRYNGGGFIAISAQLGYMIAGPAQSENKIFSKLEYNDKHPNISPTSGEPIQPYPFIDTTIGFSTDLDTGKALPSLNLSRVFILTSNRTCSASEELINGLRGIGVEVILIGDTTCGKPYGFVGTDNCGTTYFTIQFIAVNDQGFGDYADGFTPSNSTGNIGEIAQGCVVADDIYRQLGDTNEAMFNAAINYRSDGSCPPIQLTKPSKTLNQLSKYSKGNLLNDKRIHDKLLIDEISIRSLSR